MHKVKELVFLPDWQIKEDFATWSKLNKNKKFNLRFGQWFCNKYSIQSSDLFYIEDKEKALEFINENFKFEINWER